MIPTIGLMVAVLGAVVCAYVVARAMELSQRETSSSGTRAVLGLCALFALAGLCALAFLGSSLLEQGAARGAGARAPEAAPQD